MKKVMFFAYALVMTSAVFFTSCATDEVAELIDSTTDVNTSLIMTDDLVEAYADLTAVSRGPLGNDDFKPKKMKKINLDSLSDVVKAYIATNYTEATVEVAFQGKGGGYVVIVTQKDGTKLGLLFNSDGTFVKEVTKPVRGKGKNKHLTSVATDELPSAINDYLSSNYAGATIEKAAKDETGNFYIVIKKTDGSFVGLAFDSKGAFVKVLERKNKEQLTEIDVTTLSTKISEYVNGNYSGATLNKAYTNSAGDFIVQIMTTDAKKVILKFDSSGTFVKVLKKK
jgi:hypothetical protein